MSKAMHVALLACASLLALLAGADARRLTSFTVETADLKIKAPASLAKTYDMAIANFGEPLYGATLRCATRPNPARPSRVASSPDPTSRDPNPRTAPDPVFPDSHRSGGLAYPTSIDASYRTGCQHFVSTRPARTPRATSPANARIGRDESGKKKTRTDDKKSINHPPSEPPTPSTMPRSPAHPPPLLPSAPRTHQPAGYVVPKQAGFGAAILVLDRGGCPFTDKAYFAQSAGADALIVVDNVDEPLVTMDVGDDEQSSQYAANISIPVGLIAKSDGDAFKTALTAGTSVLAVLDWTDVLPHPDERVEWEFWTNSGDECGPKCDQQKAFLEDFRPIAKKLEQDGYTSFTPHYITWLCPPDLIQDPACVAQCINNGRYCCPDPDGDFQSGYSGRDVVIENLRTLCAFDQANATGQSWKWWDYVVQFGAKCTMESGNYGSESCAISILNSVQLDVEQWRQCVGDPDANERNRVLDEQQEAQVGTDGRSDVSILPTVVINDEQYRGKIIGSDILQAICAGFAAGTEPEVCGGADACDGGGGAECAKNTDTGHTSCQTSGASYKCVCPVGTIEVKKEDGTLSCQDINECPTAMQTVNSCMCERCWCKSEHLPGNDATFTCHQEPPSVCDAEGIEHPGGCWSEKGFTACVDGIEAKKQAGIKGLDPAAVPDHTCVCPKGFTGDGKQCDDVDECKAGACKDDHMTCSNTFGGHECGCVPGFAPTLSASSPDGVKCVEVKSGSGTGNIIAAVALSCGVVGGVAYGLYRWRLRSYMDQEIKAIMAQYMPLEEEPDDEENGGRELRTVSRPGRGGHDEEY